MIHALRKLARAIHRRSVWQVLVAYLAGAWGVLALVSLATETLGLPSWTGTLALVLIVTLLPLVVATAVVQGGLPGLRIEDLVDPNELRGLTPDQVHVVPEAHPLHDSTLFTWRNMVLGGVSSAALLVTSVVAYLTMWALGIGPVGSLVAQGLIAPNDPVALSVFTNHTDDTSLGALMAEAFELELSRSGVVTLVAPEDERVRLTISGEVARRGSGYVVSASIAQRGGGVLARFEEGSPGDDGLLFAIGRLTERVRERLGESLRTIREGDRLAPITTDSPAALRLYRQAGRAMDDGDLSAAVELLRETVESDASFAMAWRRLGTVLEEVGDAEGARAAYQRVVDLWGPGGSAVRTVDRIRERIAALE